MNNDTIDISIADLFEQAFGYRTSAFEPKFEQLPLRKTQNAQGTPYYATDANGREYFLPVTLSYTLSKPTGFSSQVQIGNTTQAVQDSVTELKTLVLSYPVVSVSSRKTIIETPLTERGDTFKELINIAGYEITIRGLLIGKNNDMPEEDLKKLIEVYEVNAAIGIKCALTDMFLIRKDRTDSVVIKEIRFPELQGVQHVKPYELTMVSDAPFNLNVIA